MCVCVCVCVCIYIYIEWIWVTWPSSCIQQPSRPAHDTTQSNKPPRLAAVYVYSRRASSSAIRRETRLGSRHTRPSYDKHLVPASQSEHREAPPSEYLPAQEREGWVERHEEVRVAVLHQLPSAATRHAPMLHLSSAPHFPPHTLPGQKAGTHTHTHTHTHIKKVIVQYEQSRSINEYMQVREDYSSYIYQERWSRRKTRVKHKYINI